MGSDLIPDKRLQRRGLSRREDGGLDAQLEALPDSAAGVRQLTDQELEAFRSSLETEEQMRTVRIERALARAAERTRPPSVAESEVEPLDETLDDLTV